MPGSQVDELTNALVEWAALRGRSAEPLSMEECQAEASRMISRFVLPADVPPLILDFYARELRAISLDEGSRPVAD